MYYLKTITLLFILVGVQLSKAQPGPMYINLNNGIGDFTIIDSTTDLSKISLLKNFKSISLVLLLPNLPEEFNEFDQTEFLSIDAQHLSPDLTGIEQFKKLKHLRIHNFNAKKLVHYPLQLDSLKTLVLSECKALENINCISSLYALKKLELLRVAIQQGIPDLSHTSIEELRIDNYTVEEPMHLENIYTLSQLKSLTLDNLLQIKRIPSYFPISLERLRISGWAYQADTNKRVVISDLSNLPLYTNLKHLILYALEVPSTPKFQYPTPLEFLELNNLWANKNVDWISNFSSIKHLRIQKCRAVKDLTPLTLCSIQKLELENLFELQSIDFVTNISTLNSFTFRYSNSITSVDINDFRNIPNVSISNDRLQYYKKDNQWKKTTIY